MGLGIYTQPLETTEISTDDSKVLSITIDGISGGSISKRLFVRNDDLNRFYDTIVVDVVQAADTSVIDGTGGKSWKLSEGNEEPPAEQWIRLTPAASISFSDAIGSSSRGDISTYLPFWVRIEVPAFQRRQNITTVKLRLTAQEQLVV